MMLRRRRDDRLRRKLSNSRVRRAARAHEIDENERNGRSGGHQGQKTHLTSMHTGSVRVSCEHVFVATDSNQASAIRIVMTTSREKAHATASGW
jgi:hypothetical protein